ncbi:MAG TPA: glycosyltransferase family 9 protein [Burkholderiaceae bacterium]|nr:glycosyltransferase family 9 protein [Burkholderiaceae bacterium]
MTNSRLQVCVFRALKLGDMVCATPALRALRQRFPHAHIALVGLPWARDFARRLVPWVDEFIEFDGHPQLPERPAPMAVFEAWAARMRARRFDLALQMHGSGPLSNRIVQAIGARTTAGFFPVGGSWEGLDIACQYPDGVHEVHRQLRLVQCLGGPIEERLDDKVAFPLLPDDTDELDRHDDLAALVPGRFVCLHPGARMAEKRWAAHRFAAVGDALARLGFQVVITGDASEHRLAEAVRRMMAARALNAARDLSVGALAALLARSRLLVSNDTGVAHIAAALRLPSVVIFFVTDRLRWAPLDARRHRCVEPVRDGHRPASAGVLPADVLAAVQEVLREPWRPAAVTPRRATVQEGLLQPEFPAASHRPAQAPRTAAGPAQ